MKTSVVILNWNGKNWLEKFLPSVVTFSNSKDVEVVVADNSSTDDSTAFLAEHYPQIRIIVLTKNWGFAEGYNKAIDQIESKYTVLLNSDVEVTPDWLTELTNYLDSNEDTAAVQPKILSQLDQDTFEYAGAAGGFIDQYGYPFCRGRIFSSVEKDKSQYDQTTDIFWATGACLMIRTDIYKSVGGLDASFFAHQEEIDLCWRLRSRGYRIACVTSSTVFHVGGGTLAQESPRKTFLNFRNNLLMLYKNLPDKDLAYVLRARKVLDMLSYIQFRLTGKAKNAQAIRDARKEFKKIQPTYAKQREINLAKSKEDKFPEMYRGLLLFPYYLKGWKKFSDIHWK